MREYEERREIEKFFEKAKNQIKKQIEMKGVSCKGSAKGTALSEIIAILDDEMEINIAEELVTARRAIPSKNFEWYSLTRHHITIDVVKEDFDRIFEPQESEDEA